MTAVKNLTERSAIVPLLFLILLCTIPSAYALNVDVVDPDTPLKKILVEGETVEFTLSIYGYIYNNRSIRLETDLEKCGDSPIYKFKVSAAEYIEGDEYEQDIRIIAPQNGDSIEVEIKGVPPSSVRTERDLEKIKVIEFDEGPFNYYNIEILDPHGQVIPSEIGIKEFKVDITELNEFHDNKMRDIKSKGMEFTDLKTFAERLHGDGLVNEANELADLLLKLPTPECKVNYFIFAGIKVRYFELAIFIVVLLLLGGWRVGRKIYDAGHDKGHDKGYADCIAKLDDDGD